MSEERWGWRFAVGWRAAIACLMVAYFVIRLVIAWKILVLQDGPDVFWMFFGEISRRCFANRDDRSDRQFASFVSEGQGAPWSWPVRLLAWIAAGVLCVDVPRDHLLLPALVHITIAGVQAAWPLAWAPDILPRTARHTSRGSSALRRRASSPFSASCGVCSGSFRSGGDRAHGNGSAWGVRLAASLAITVLMAGRIAFVEVPSITPLLAAEIHVPKPQRLVAPPCLRQCW